MAFDWSAIRDFLIVAEAGSLSAASERLGVSQPTMGRRIAALEESLGGSLFVRTARGLHLTESGERIFDRARTMAEAAHEVEAVATGTNQSLNGIVRLSTSEAFGTEWLPAHLAQFHLRYPAIVTETIVRDELVDLVRREADIAVRNMRPDQPDLIARRVGELAFGAYASPTYLDRMGMPRDLEEMAARHMFVLPEEAASGSIRRHFSDYPKVESRVRFRSNSSVAQLTAVSNGIGIGFFSALGAWRSPHLVRVAPDVDLPKMEIWMVTHPELRKSARIRVMWDFLTELFDENKVMLASLPTAS